MPARRRRTRAAVLLVGVCLLLPAFVAGAAAGERTVIGHSVRGRAIVAVHIAGSGPARGVAPGAALKMLVVGCIHGDETAGVAVARRLIVGGALRDTELWVVPTINPDGVAAETRGNAHGVDLNRNFSFDWAHLVGGEYSGTGPLSEPESRAARRLIQRIQPDVTIWFHQPFGIVDRSGGDPFVERRFAQLVGLPLVRLPGRYPGSATRWQNHAFPASTAFVVELPAAVSGALTDRARSAIRSLASELASPAVGGATATNWVERDQAAGVDHLELDPAGARRSR
jgi:protein MpaA